MTKMTISLTAVFLLSFIAPNAFARDVNTLEKVRESLWLKGVGTATHKITMTYANNDLAENLEIPVNSDSFDEKSEEIESDNTDLPEELFVPLQDV